MTFGLLNAQNNLIFNRALTFQLGPQQGVTVPDGKVWKIESFDRDSGSGSLTVDIANGVNGTPVTSASFISTPIWLEAGTILKPATSTINFSILEFNLSSANSGGGSTSGGVSSDGLIFSQVINYTTDFSANSSSPFTTTLTIPDGKAWKIMDVNIFRKNGLLVLKDDDGLVAQLGEIFIHARFTSGYSPKTVEYPTWINSGNKELRITNIDNTAESFRITISAIEYTIPE